MRMHRFAKICALVVALSPAVALAHPGIVTSAQPPHDMSFSDGECDHCHSLSNRTPLGGFDYSAGCNSCHANQVGSTFSFPRSDQEAKPGVRGTHHSWTGFATNPAAGATAPGGIFQEYLVEGRLQCILCHDMHYSSPTVTAPDRRYTSIPVGVAQNPLAGATGTAKLTLVEPGTTAVGYRLRLRSATSFIITKQAHRTDAGQITWLNWDDVGSVWYAGTITGPGKSFAANTPVAIEPGVQVQWTTGGQAGDMWEFFVGYPALRMSAVGDSICTACHGEMHMGYVRTSGMDAAYAVDGVRTFSHPVGEALNANGRGTDVTAIVDADGRTQAVGDGNATNDLKLDGTIVRCTTCHAVHGADSNSLTTDP
jgi:hypothetical protein